MCYVQFIYPLVYEYTHHNVCSIDSRIYMYTVFPGKYISADPGKRKGERARE